MTNKKLIPHKFSVAIPTCDDNEYYSQCGDDGCQDTCPGINSRKRNRLRLKDESDTCRPKCSEGACICMPGFVRNSDGACIPSEECREYIF